MLKILLIIFINFYIVIAQINFNTAKIVASGNSSVAFSRGIESIQNNPSNLAFFDKKNWEISFLPQINLNFQNSIFSYGEYKKYFIGNADKSPKHLSDKDKNDILSLFNSQEYEEIFLNSSIGILNISSNFKELKGGFCISINERLYNFNSIPKEAFRLILFGNTLNTNYKFNDLNGSGIWFREYSIGYGFQLYNKNTSKIAFGIILKYLNGMGYYSIYNTNSNFLTTDSSINGNMNVKINYAFPNFFKENNKYSFFESSGKGQSFDIGLSYIPNDIFSFGASIQDFGYIIWKKNSYEIEIDTTSEIKNIFEEDEYKPLKDLFNNHKKEIYNNKTILPYTIKIGFAININKISSISEIISFPVILGFQYSQINKSKQLLNRNYNFISLGLDLVLLKWFPIRLGYSHSKFSSDFSFGTGINTTIFDLDIALSNLQLLFLSKSIKTFGITISTKFLF